MRETQSHIIKQSIKTNSHHRQMDSPRQKHKQDRKRETHNRQTVTFHKATHSQKRQIQSFITSTKSLIIFPEELWDCDSYNRSNITQSQTNPKKSQTSPFVPRWNRNCNMYNLAQLRTLDHSFWFLVGNILKVKDKKNQRGSILGVHKGIHKGVHKGGP